MPSLARMAAACTLLAATAAAPLPQVDVLLDAPELVSADVVLLGLDAAGRMTVPVSIAGAATVPFVVDTGAERTVLSAELGRALGLAAGPRVRLISMSGALTSSSFHVPRLDLSGQTIHGLIAPALQGRHIGAAGIIGLDSLQDRRILLDFHHGTMSIEPSSVREERWDPDTIVVRGRSRYGQLILVDADFEGQRIAVILDTGAQSSIGNRALQRRLSRRRGQPLVLTSVTGGTLLADGLELGTVRVGGIEFQNLPVAFADAPPFERLGLGDSPAMLLGMDAMQLFERVSIDFANRRVRFEPGPRTISRFFDPVRLSTRTGRLVRD